MVRSEITTKKSSLTRNPIENFDLGIKARKILFGLAKAWLKLNSLSTTTHPPKLLRHFQATIDADFGYAAQPQHN